MVSLFVIANEVKQSRLLGRDAFISSLRGAQVAETIQRIFRWVFIWIADSHRGGPAAGLLICHSEEPSGDEESRNGFFGVE